MASKASPQPPALEQFHNLKQATVKLGLSDPEDPDDKRGQWWLRQGVNRKQNPFPCTRMAGQLMFSDSQLAEIAEISANQPTRRGRYQRRRKPVATARTAKAA